MLKNFMHSSPSSDPKPTGISRAETNRVNPSPYESAKLAESTKKDSVDGNKLIVGPNIKLKGSEITDCEILVVEGRVEASMNSRDIRIAEGGVFSGKAEIDVAEIRGHFEGELTARKRLVIYATGKVSGVIRYGAMSIEEGGILSGDVATLSAGARVGKVSEISAESGQGEASSLELARNAIGKRQA